MHDLLVVGGGVMGAALALGMGGSQGGPRSVAILDHNPEKAHAIASRLPGGVVVNKLEPAKIYLLAVKPHHIRGVLSTLPPHSKAISIAAGVRLDQLRAWAPAGCEIVRAMPNTACEVGAGVTAVCSEDDDGSLLTAAQELFALVGDVFIVPEKQFDVVSAMSGSGPAYVFLLIEAMQEAGITLGLSASLALDLARATVRGAGLLAHAKREDPRNLRLAVTSPGGMTAAAIAVFEEFGLRHQTLEAIRSATQRAQALSERAGQ
ncbi:pyrroline-5-carboxylate reductase [Ferrimicrobium sp.]|uniref:pyrroline-5-carboxylate reductase n=1 Tax=Ferrimicrobium sp. TaxID=2926050 RepID=UPI00262922B4|nr:pyrroline-5-carboxylate reductase [Ferrimicrobium sp.]